jgi:hypothetical protein
MQDHPARLVWPTLHGVPSTQSAAASAKSAASAATATLPTPATPSQIAPPQDVWEYIAEHIDEFAVAKSIADHFDAFPKDLQNKEVDALGLYLRARVTLKRQQVACAEMQKAMAAAEQSSRSLRGRATRALRFCRDVRCAVLADPAPALIVCAIAVLAVWSH